MPFKDPEKRRENAKKNYSSEKRRNKHLKHYQKYRAWLWDLKDKPCFDCGGSFHPAAMDFHHLEPGTKERTMNNYASKSKVLAEIEKCVLLCSNCHRVRHAPQDWRTAEV